MLLLCYRYNLQYEIQFLLSAVVEILKGNPKYMGAFLNPRPRPLALAIASCGLKLDDEAARVAVGLRLELDLCVTHECYCGSRIDAYAVYSFFCNRPPGQS